MDSSDASARAFAHALGIVRRAGALLTIVHAVPPFEPVSWHARHRAEWLKELRAQAAEAGVRLRIALQAGKPSEIILAHANGHAYDLLVLGTAQRTGVERLRAGSVAERVAAGAALPVLVVPASSRSERPGVYERVLHPTRLGEGSGQATAYALAMAEAGAERVTLVHAVPPPPPDWPMAYAVPRRVPDQSSTTEAWQALNEQVGNVTYRGLVHGRVLVGRAVDAVQTAAESGRVDLVVVGRRRRGPVPAWWTMGRFTPRLLRRLSCPVLVVPDDAAYARNVLAEAARRGPEAAATAGPEAPLQPQRPGPGLKRAA